MLTYLIPDLFHCERHMTVSDGSVHFFRKVSFEYVLSQIFMSAYDYYRKDAEVNFYEHLWTFPLHAVLLPMNRESSTPHFHV